MAKWELTANKKCPHRETATKGEKRSSCLIVTNDISDGEVDRRRRVVRLDAYVIQDKRDLILLHKLVGRHGANDAVEAVSLHVGKRTQNMKFQNMQVSLSHVLKNVSKLLHYVEPCVIYFFFFFFFLIYI